MAKTTFAERLKALRESAGLTQAALAERAGMNPFGVAKLEQGVREPTWATVQALCKALNISCEEFLDDAAGTPQADATEQTGPAPTSTPPTQKKDTGARGKGKRKGR
jgi:transcriptional regulator with XRE-family HTH domain